MNDAVSRRLRSGILEQTGATVDVLQSDTMDHYRTFYMLERLLHSPPKLLNQLLFQIPPCRQTMLIERCGAGLGGESWRWGGERGCFTGSPCSLRPQVLRVR